MRLLRSPFPIRFAFSLGFIAAATLLMPAPAFTQCTDYGGSILSFDSFDTSNGSGIAIVGDIGYVSRSDSTFAVVDLSDPFAPLELGRLDLGRPARQVVAGPDYVYAAASYLNETELFVIDVADPTEPVVLSSVTEAASLLDLDANGNIVYVLTLNRLALYDVSDPLNPQLLGSEGVIDKTTAMDLKDDMVYISGRAFGLHIVDATDPTALETISYTDSWKALDIAIVGDYAFLSGLVTSFYVIDISNPVAPVLTNRVAYPGSFELIQQDDLLLGTGLSTLFALDISNPIAPAIVGTAPISSPRRLASQNNFVWSADLDLYNIAELNVGAVTGYYDIGGSSRGLALGGDRAYVASTTGAQTVFDLFDVSDRTAPLLLGSTTFPGRPREVALSGQFAYVTDDENGTLQVVDITNEASPVRVGEISLIGEVLGVAVDASRAYVAAGTGGLHILDLSNPAVPTLLGSIDTPGEAKDVSVAKGLAFVADGDEGVFAVDITNPASPVLLDQFNTVGDAQRLSLAVELLFVGDGPGGVQILDVSDPQQISMVSEVSTSHRATEIAVDGSTVYVGSDDSRAYEGVEVFDVSNPSLPENIGFAPCPGWVRDIAVSDGSLFIADGDLAIVAPQCAPTAIEEPPTTLPMTLTLGLPQPNPATNRMTLQFQAPSGARADARVFTSQGRLVRMLRSRIVSGQVGKVEWDGRDENGRRVPAGTYHVSVRAGDRSGSRLVTILQ